MNKLKLKNVIWALVVLASAGISTYKMTLLYFYYIAETNNTTAPFVALLTSIPVGFALFHVSVAFFRTLVKLTRLTLKSIA